MRRTIKSLVNKELFRDKEDCITNNFCFLALLYTEIYFKNQIKSHCQLLIDYHLGTFFSAKSCSIYLGKNGRMCYCYYYY